MKTLDANASLVEASIVDLSVSDILTPLINSEQIVVHGSKIERVILRGYSEPLISQDKMDAVNRLAEIANALPDDMADRKRCALIALREALCPHYMASGTAMSIARKILEVVDDE